MLPVDEAVAAWALIHPVGYPGPGHSLAETSLTVKAPDVRWGYLIRSFYVLCMTVKHPPAAFIFKGFDQSPLQIRRQRLQLSYG